MSERRLAIVLDPSDNVATVIEDLPAGLRLETAYGDVTLIEPIAFGHKVALRDIPLRAEIIKYGAAIGRATSPIPAGSHVHVHNVEDIVDEVRKAG